MSGLRSSSFNVYENSEEFLKRENAKRDRVIDKLRKKLVDAWILSEEKFSKGETPYPTFKRVVRPENEYFFGVYDPERLCNGGMLCYVDADGKLFLATSVFSTREEFMEHQAHHHLPLFSETLVRSISQEHAEDLLLCR